MLLCFWGVTYNFFCRHGKTYILLYFGIVLRTPLMQKNALRIVKKRSNNQISLRVGMGKCVFNDALIRDPFPFAQKGTIQQMLDR